jgi:hypothetical protein
MASVTARPGNKASSSTLSFWEAAEDGTGGAIVTRVTMTRRMYMSRVHNCAARTALDSSPPAFVEYPKLVVPFRRSFGALIVALAAMLAAAQPDPATAEDRGAIPLQARSGCIVGHRFEPGPIVGGHNRQPTIREFQWRTRELLELEQRDAYNCVGSPVSNEVTTRPSPAG